MTRGLGAAPAGSAGVTAEQVRYRRRRRTAHWVYLLVVVATVVIGGRELLLRSPRFTLHAVTVTGAVDVPVAAVKAAAGLRAGVPLLTVDLGMVERGVATLPLIDSVRASRRWPGTVLITVHERIPVALAASPSGPRLVDRTGLAYRPAGPRPPALPRLAASRVAPGDPATVAGLAVLSALPAAVRTQVRVVEAGGPSDVTLLLSNGKQVRWGGADESDRKAAVLGVLMAQSGSVYDVSAPELPTVRR